MLNSIFKRTPPSLLIEIIIYDDYSTLEIETQLKDYLKLKTTEWPQEKLIFLKATKREGLIRARVRFLKRDVILKLLFVLIIFF